MSKVYFFAALPPEYSEPNLDLDVSVFHVRHRWKRSPWIDQDLPEKGTSPFAEHFSVEDKAGLCLCYPQTDMQG